MSNTSGAIVAVALALAVGNIASGGIAGAACVTLLVKNRLGPLLAKAALICDVAYNLIGLAGGLAGSMSLGDSSPVWFKPVGYSVAALIWLVYLMRSRRVANTFCTQPLPLNS